MITGDLANSGTASQYELADQFLRDLRAWIGEASDGAEPLIIPVPGNHDLARPQGRDARSFVILEKYGEGADNELAQGLIEELWTERDASSVEPLFAPYLEWLRRSILPQDERPGVTVTPSHFPGDLTVHVDLEGRFRLSIVALNSAWIQYTGGNFEGRLELPAAQFHAALAGKADESPLAALERSQRALLLMHHPESWLSPRSQDDFRATIYTPDRFALCLHGHLHAGRSVGISRAGGPPRYFFQAPSLFGLEHYGTAREERAIGYAWGQITAGGEVRIWPRKRTVHGDGTVTFVHDPEFHGDAKEGFVLRPAAPRPPPEVDAGLDAYCRWARERHRGLSMIGVGGGDLRFRFEEVYVPLRISQRPVLKDLDERTGKRRGETALEHGSADLELEEIFTRARSGGPHVAIFGDPGAGKTTALVKLHHQCLTAGPESLGLAAGTVPVLLRLRRLREKDLEAPLAEVLQRELSETSGGELPGDLGARLWQHGRLLLLLDGLDEIADETLRAKVCKYLEWHLPGGSKKNVRAVVSCRYTGYGGTVKLDERFLHVDVRPLDAEQCRTLVRLWFWEAQRALPNYPEREAREAAAGLIAALDGAAQRLKVLVGSPLLLTLLCVVVLRGGEMPRHRAKFFEQCLRVLLAQWSRERDQRPALDVDAALAVLRPLAYRLHAEHRRDDLSRPELVFHVEERLEQLGKTASAFRVVEWLHREAGVIDEYAPQHYGFVHLGIQEYLAALHLAEGKEPLDALCADCAEEWWREVVLLVVALPGRRVFAPLMERLLASDALREHPDLLRACIAEAAEVDPEPFYAVLDAGEPARQAAVLRLLRGRTDPALLERAEALAGSTDPDVAALAGQMVAGAQRPPPGDAGYDLLLVYHAAEEASAAELRKLLDRQGLRVLATAGSAWMADLERIVEQARGAALLFGPSGELPWQGPAIDPSLRLLARRGRALVPVLLPGSGEAPPLPGHLPGLSWVDLRQGLAAGSAEAIARALRAPAEGAPAISPRLVEPVPGQAFTEAVTAQRFLWIPAGRFRMGGDAYPDEQPVHWVRISPFWLAETPVTNRQYATFLKETGNDEPEYWRNRRFSGGEQPVVGVSWHDAVAYCRWLSERSRLTVTLPTEAQWEYAARGTDGREYPWGNEKPDSSRACFGLKRDEGRSPWSLSEGCT